MSGGSVISEVSVTCGSNGILLSSGKREEIFVVMRSESMDWMGESLGGRSHKEQPMEYMSGVLLVPTGYMSPHLA